jgi:hypothetical protein
VSVGNPDSGIGEIYVICGQRREYQPPMNTDEHRLSRERELPRSSLRRGLG